jgi:hypothetical protein
LILVLLFLITVYLTFKPFLSLDFFSILSLTFYSIWFFLSGLVPLPLIALFVCVYTSWLLFFLQFHPFSLYCICFLVYF